MVLYGTYPDPPPDLVITDITLNPEDQYEDGLIEVTVTVENQGLASANDVNISLFFNLDHQPGSGDYEDMSINIGSLSPDSSTNTTVSIYYQDFNLWGEYGRYNIHAYVDFYNEIEEQNEDNNTYGLVKAGWIQYPTSIFYNWPLAPTSQSHEISSVPNEPRNAGRIHRGIDIPAINGTPIYSVCSGKVIEWSYIGTNNEKILTKGTSSENDCFEYIHIKNPLYTQGKWIYQNDIQIAEIRDYGNNGPQGDHLHFNDYTQYGDPESGGDYYATNPINFYGLNYNYDDNLPEIDPDYFRVQINGSDSVISRYGIYGDVDFIIAVRDKSYSDKRIGIAKIRFEINGSVFERVILDGNKVFNDDVFPYLYCSECGNLYDEEGYYYMYITNYIIDPSEEFQGSFHSEDFPDGYYVLMVTVEDYAGNSISQTFEIKIDQSSRMEDKINAISE